jgi:hypothetical protein
MAQSKVNVSVSYATPAELQTWLTNLATDVAASKVESFQVYTNPGGSGDGVIEGELTLSSSTAVSDLTVAVEDA